MTKPNYKLLLVLLHVFGLLLYLIGHGESFAACNTTRTFADGLSPIREIHVAADGSDTNGDGSVDSPFGTIGYGISQLVTTIHPVSAPMRCRQPAPRITTMTVMRTVGIWRSSR